MTAVISLAKINLKHNRISDPAYFFYFIGDVMKVHEPKHLKMQS
jgi:hypothetical protein